MEGFNTGHENGDGMASFGVRIEPPVRLVTGAWADEPLIVLHLQFGARQMA